MDLTQRAACQATFITAAVLPENVAALLWSVKPSLIFLY